MSASRRAWHAHVRETPSQSHTCTRAHAHACVRVGMLQPKRRHQHTRPDSGRTPSSMTGPDAPSGAAATRSAHSQLASRPSPHKHSAHYPAHLQPSAAEIAGVRGRATSPPGHFAAFAERTAAAAAAAAACAPQQSTAERDGRSDSPMQVYVPRNAGSPSAERSQTVTAVKSSPQRQLRGPFVNSSPQRRGPVVSRTDPRSDISPDRQPALAHGTEGQRTLFDASCMVQPTGRHSPLSPTGRHSPLSPTGRHSPISAATSRTTSPEPARLLGNSVSRAVDSNRLAYLDSRIRQQDLGNSGGMVIDRLSSSTAASNQANNNDWVGGTLVRPLVKGSSPQPAVQAVHALSIPPGGSAHPSRSPSPEAVRLLGASMQRQWEAPRQSSPTVQAGLNRQSPSRAPSGYPSRSSSPMQYVSGYAAPTHYDSRAGSPSFTHQPMLTTTPYGYDSRTSSRSASPSIPGFEQRGSRATSPMASGHASRSPSPIMQYASRPRSPSSNLTSRDVLHTDWHVSHSPPPPPPLSQQRRPYTTSGGS